MIRLGSLMMVLLLFSCGGEEERLKVQRDIANLQEQLYELERTQAQIREQVAQTNAEITEKLEDRTSQAEMKDRLYTLQESLSQYEARIVDLERLVAQMSRTSRTVTAPRATTPDNTSSDAATDYPTNSVSNSDVKKLYEQSLSDFNRGKTDVAMLGFENIINSFPDSEFVEAAHYYAGRAAHKQKDWPTAVKHFEIVSNRIGRGDYTRQALYYLGEVYYYMNSNYKAVLTLRDVIRNYPGTQEADLAKKFLRDAGYEK